MNNLVVVLLKWSKYWVFYKDFNIAFDFPVFFNWAIFPWIWSMNILLLRYLMQSFLFNYLSTTILHTKMNNLVVVLMKSSKYWVFYKDFNIALDFPVFLIGQFFLWTWSMNILLIRYIRLSYQINCLSMSISHIIMNKLVVVLLKSSKY